MSTISIIDILFSDNIMDIVSYLTIKEKIKFLSLAKDLHSLKDKIHYHDIVYIGKIYHLWYYDRFTHVIVNYIQYKLPNSITHLTFDDYFNTTINEYIHIPKTMTHLTFGWEFNQNIK